MKQRIFLIIIGSVIATCSLMAQNAMQFPYFCGFENGLDGWVLDNDQNNPNKWTLGIATASDGNNSIYISPDNGNSASYVAATGLQIAYKDFTLPVGSRYEIAFDWRCMGSNYDRLYVCWLPAAQPIKPSTFATLPTWLTSYWVAWSGNGVKGDTIMSNSNAWQHGQFEVPGTGVPYRLVFCWISADTGEAPRNPGACIDNVQVGKKITCPKPQALDYLVLTDASGVFAWYGNSEKYELKYKNNKSIYWTEHKDLTSTYDTIAGLSKGTYTIWVRGICGNDTSIWAVYNNLLVYVSSDMCVDYINFKNPEVALADVGKSTGILNEPYELHGVGAVDYGSSSSASSHTVHTDISELDPRTGYKLKTIPDGEVASVRLGNWGIGGFAERISYFYTVDKDMSILLLKYAVVLENPNHSEAEQPRFTLKLLDEQGRMINPTCGSADFIPSKNTEKWQKYGSVEWKDWTSLGLNLEDYVGQTIQIQLATYDCSPTGHYGYAYFTLDCAAAKISGLSCGDNAVEALGVPEGFAYRWYPANNPDTTVSTTNKFQPEKNDTSEYVCRLTYLEDNKESTNCYFELRASLMPRFPAADMEYTVKENECDVEVSFKNKSYVYTSKGTIANQCDAYFWDFGDGTTSSEENPVHVYKHYGVYNVTLKSSIANGECEDIFTQVVDVSFDKEPVKVQIPDSTFEMCPEGTEFGVPFQILSGVLDSCEVIYADKKMKVEVDNATSTFSFPVESLTPGIYQAKLVVYGHCVVDTIPVAYRVDFPSDIIGQRWNDVLGLKNEQHNGGYDFTNATLQWYENGIPMEGETGTVLYRQGQNLDPNATYQLGITMDGKLLLTCPFAPIAVSQQDETISLDQTFFNSGDQANIQAVAKAHVKIYDGMGVVCEDYCINEGMNQVPLPVKRGIYIVEITLLDGTQMVQKIVIQ